MQNASNAQYAPTPTPTTCVACVPPGTPLPHTGYPASSIGAAGLVLVVCGFALWRLTRRFA